MLQSVSNTLNKSDFHFVNVPFTHCAVIVIPFTVVLWKTIHDDQPLCLTNI